jgi:patatin-like phospholipase/acyl hydrolase
MGDSQINFTSIKVEGPFRVLSLDGGGAKGFYTLGVLKEIEAASGRPICESFDLIFGTSTGGIIAALLALGYSVDAIHNLYQVPVFPAREVHVLSFQQSKPELSGPLWRYLIGKSARVRAVQISTWSSRP